MSGVAAGFISVATESVGLKSSPNRARTWPEPGPSRARTRPESRRKRTVARGIRRTPLGLGSWGSIRSLIKKSVPKNGEGESWGRGQQISVAGLVTGLRRRGSRVTLELDDGGGRLEVTLFGETYDQFRHLLTAHNVVVISGRLRFDEYIDGWRLTAKDVTDIDRIVESRATGLLIRWDSVRQGPLDAGRLKGLLEPFRYEE